MSSFSVSIGRVDDQHSMLCLSISATDLAGVCTAKHWSQPVDPQVQASVRSASVFLNAGAGAGSGTAGTATHIFMSREPSTSEPAVQPVASITYAHGNLAVATGPLVVHASPVAIEGLISLLQLANGLQPWPFSALRSKGGSLPVRC